MKLSKKVLSLFAVAALLVSLLSVMSFTIASADETNLIQNGDFENGETGWTLANTDAEKFQVWTSQGVDNSSSLTRVGSNCWAGGITCSQTITVTPGKTYVFTAYVKNTEGQKVGTFGVADGSNVADAFGTAGTGNCLVKETPALTTAWTAVTFEFTPTQNTATVAVRQDGGIVTRATLFIDNVSVVAKKVYPTEIINGSFEDGLNGWSMLQANSTDRFAQWASNARTGSNSLLRIGSNTWAKTVMYQTIAVIPGKAYTFSAWFKYIQSNSPTVYFGVADGINPDDVYTQGDNTLVREGIAVSNSSHASYKEVTFDFTPTKDTATVAFWLGGGNVSSFYVDDVSVTEKVGPAASVTMANKTIIKKDVTTDSLSIEWGAAGGTAAAADITYSVYCSESEITADNIGSLTPFVTVNGADELKATKTGLASGNQYYFAVKAAIADPDVEGHSDAIFAGPFRTIPTGSTELLVNGGFENIKLNGDDCGFCDEEGPDYGCWKLITARTTELPMDDFAAATRKITSTEKHGGSYALSFRFNSTLFHSVKQAFPISKGYKYTVSFWYKGMAGAIAGVGPDWNMHVTKGYDVMVETAECGEWTKYTMVYYPKQDGEMSLWLTGPTKDEGTECIFDDISIVEEYAPVYFTATDIPVNKITKDSVDVSWEAPTVQDGAAAVTGYKVYVSESQINVDNVASLTPVATVTDKAYTFASLKANTGYYFAVEATNGTNSAYVFSAQPVYTQKDEEAPAAGTNLIIDGGFDLYEEFSANPRDGWHLVNNAGQVFLFWGGVHTDVGDPMKLGSACVYPWQQTLVQWVQVKPNTTYAYTFNSECYLEDGGPGLRVYERKDGKWNGNLLSDTKVTTDSGIGTSYQGTFTTGAETTEVYINPYNLAGGAGAECYFDEIYLVEVEDISLYMLGGLTQVEYGEDYLIVSWPKAQADEEASKLTYKVYTSDEPITAANIGSLTPFATVAGDDEYREAELSDLKPGTTRYFAVSVTNSQGKTAYLFSDNAFTTDGEPEEDESDNNTGNGGNTGNAGGNTGNDSTGGSNADDDNTNTDGEESTSPVTGETVTLLVVALLAVLLSAGVLVFTKRRAHN